jgi:cytochrome c oxidase assembly protein subunit 15
VAARPSHVTGSGPHAGDIDSPRNGLNPLQVSQLHADLVFLFVGLTVGPLYAVRAAGRPAIVRRVVLALLGVELAQGTIGFVQYFTDLPVVLVGFHLLGAALVSATATWMLLAVREAPPQTDPRTERTTAGPHPRGQALPSSSP